MSHSMSQGHMTRVTEVAINELPVLNFEVRLQSRDYVQGRGTISKVKPK